MASISIIRNQRAQGLVEYLIIVAIMGVACMAIMRVVGGSVSAQFARVANSIQGKTGRVDMPDVEETMYKKKDLSDYHTGSSH